MNGLKLKIFAKKAVRAICAPLVDKPGRLVCLSALCFMPQLAGILAYSGYSFGNGIVAFVYILLEGLLLPWLLLALYPARKRGARIYWGALMTFFAILAITDIFFLIFYGQTFNPMYLGVIMGSNTSELQEFLKTFADIRIALWVCGSAAITVIAYFAGRKLKVRNRVAAIIMAIGLPTSVVLYLCNPGVCHAVSSLPLKFIIHPKHLIRCFSANIESPEHVDLRPNGSDGVTNIVVVIGESASRRHSSLYGYEHETNPCLDSLLTTGRLWVFDDVTASATHTIEAFKTLLGTCTDPDEKDWNRQTTIIDAARAAGYSSFWISNQNKAGFFDNAVTKFALTADTAAWTEKVKFTGNAQSDEAVIGLLQKLLPDKNKGHNLVVIHLMGSHTKFSSRYPSSFNKFNSNDYGNRPANQRQTVAEYDNSIRYTDYVLSEIFKTFDGSDALVIYFPDHGLDLYVTDPEYFDHAKPDNEESARVSREIPFVVYGTSEFVRRHSDMASAIAANRSMPICTTDLIYSVVNAMGYTLGGDTFHPSVFRK